MAAMIRMIATTISNSISEKPFCFRISCFPLLRFQVWSVSTRWLLLRTSSAKKPEAINLCYRNEGSACFQ
jgi:hypothetical protein